MRSRPTELGRCGTQCSPPIQAAANSTEAELGDEFETADIEKSPPRRNHELAVTWITRTLMLAD
jgi:hypothetical protein